MNTPRRHLQRRNTLAHTSAHTSAHYSLGHLHDLQAHDTRDAAEDLPIVRTRADGALTIALALCSGCVASAGLTWLAATYGPALLQAARSLL